MAESIRTLTLKLLREPGSARVARRAVENLLDELAPITFTRDAILLTSELIANAILHTAGGCELRAWFRPSLCLLRVEVLDESTVLPVVPEPRVRRSVGGHGMLLVDDVATSWGASAAAGGKVVWFELADDS